MREQGERGAAVEVAKPEHDHCKQVLASKRIRDCCFTGWDTSREPYFPEDKGCYYMAANLEICPTTGRDHWQGIACFNTVQPAGKVRGMLGQPTAHVGQRVGELSDCIGGGGLQAEKELTRSYLPHSRTH